MQRLGLNPTDQEVVDIPMEIGKHGLIYFPDFCNLVLKWLRKDEVENELFYQNMFKVPPVTLEANQPAGHVWN